MLKTILLFLLFSVSFSEDFSDGPYGNNYFDTAGPFNLPDLNIEIKGDINFDETINIQDVILLVGEIIGSYNFNDNEFNAADTNGDNIIDILDIVDVINKILNPQDAAWNFEEQWTGNESYIFIHYQTNVSSSTALWGSNTREELLTNSPPNVHYFFLSSRSQYESDINYMKSEFDYILESF